MPTWEGKSRGSKTGYRIFVWLLKQGGVRPAYFLLKFVTLYFYFFSFSASRALYSFYRKRIGFGILRSLFGIYRNYDQLGQSLIDKVALMSGMANPFSFHFDGEEHLHEMVMQGRGGMLLSGHLGNWDIAGHLLKRLNTPINIVIFDGEHEQIKAYLDSVTGEKSVKMILIKNNLSHIYEISDALKRNELICMHADRFLPGNKTQKQIFLGSNAAFPIGPFVLASTFRVPVSFVFAVKESALHYHFFATKGNDYAHLDKAAQMKLMLTDFVREMEIKTRAYPWQWFNFYDFWK